MIRFIYHRKGLKGEKVILVSRSLLPAKKFTFTFGFGHINCFYALRCFKSENERLEVVIKLKCVKILYIKTLFSDRILSVGAFKEIKSYFSLF